MLRKFTRTEIKTGVTCSKCGKKVPIAHVVTADGKKLCPICNKELSNDTK